MSAAGCESTTLRHGRVSLVLHQLSAGDGTPLLLLHEWRSDAHSWEGRVDAWPGPVHALDFGGHGGSDPLRGGAYALELFAADADVALAEIGIAALAGAGSGAYVALLLAGARPEAVQGALLWPGAGLDGGGARPDFDHPKRPWRPAPDAVGPPDPWLVETPGDVRPDDYAEAFGRAARRLLLVEDGGPRPPWWRAVARIQGVGTTSPDEAWTRLAASLGG